LVQPHIRKVAEAPILLKGPVTLIKGVKYRIQRKLISMIIHLDWLVPYQENAQDE
jgi:hypothetical protein